jgi:hypothetical protein
MEMFVAEFSFEELRHFFTQNAMSEGLSESDTLPEAQIGDNSINVEVSLLLEPGISISGFITNKDKLGVSFNDNQGFCRPSRDLTGIRFFQSGSFQNGEHIK